MIQAIQRAHMGESEEDWVWKEKVAFKGPEMRIERCNI
jgi:hypothetical protein